MSSPSNKPTTPAPLIQMSLEDFKNHPERFVALLNEALQNENLLLNQLLGFNGPISFNSHVDMRGNRVTGVAAPQSPTDAVSHITAQRAYSAPVLRPQLEADGPYPLRGYRQLSNPSQQELSSSHLNTLASIAPIANDSRVTFGVVGGGFVPVTISAGIFTRADGTTVPYPQFNDSVALPADFTLATLSRTGGVVSGSTTGANTMQIGDTVAVVITSGDASFQGSFVLTSSATPNFTYNQNGPDANAATGSPPVLTGKISLFGVYYYCLKPSIGVLYRVGPYLVDSTANRINAQKDGSALIAVATVNGIGGDVVNSAAGDTSPADNVGSGQRLIPI